MTSMTWMGFDIPPRLISNCSARDPMQSPYILIYCLSEALSHLCALAQVILLPEGGWLPPSWEIYSLLMSQLYCHLCGSLFFCSQAEIICPLLCTPNSLSTFWFFKTLHIICSSHGIQSLLHQKPFHIHSLYI